MKEYKISGAITVSCFTKVEANSPEEALEIAKKRRVADITINAFDQEEDEAWNFDSDGEPFDIRIDEY